MQFSIQKCVLLLLLLVQGDMTLPANGFVIFISPEIIILYDFGLSHNAKFITGPRSKNETILYTESNENKMKSLTKNSTKFNSELKK